MRRPRIIMVGDIQVFSAHIPASDRVELVGRGVGIETKRLGVEVRKRDVLRRAGALYGRVLKAEPPTFR